MDISFKRIDGILLIKIDGRLDAYGALAMDEALEKIIQDEDLSVVFDMDNVSYLSSGGIRSFLRIEKILRKKGGHISLYKLNPYPLEVLEMAGFDQIFSVHSTLEDALNAYKIPKKERIDWVTNSLFEDDNVSLDILEFSQDKATLKVVGDISKVLHSQLEEKDIYSRRFSDTEYSIGLGGLGERNKDFFEIMGEMITIGGTMVWLPTDGHDTPDFLIPAKDTGMVTIRTGFNVALDGYFQDIIMVESKKEEGFSVDELYLALFQMARQMRPSFKGIISVAMQADIRDFYSSGVKISPIEIYAPENREMIMHPDNIDSWMDIQTKPQFSGQTMVSFGMGVDLETDLSSYDPDVLSSLFYLHPANIGNQKILLHNHAVVFKHVPCNKDPDLDGKIRKIVREGEFLDMRHLLDNTRLKRALIGVSYISDILFDVNKK